MGTNDKKSATNVPPTANHDQTAATRGRVQRHRHPALRRPPREVVRPLHAQRLRGDLAVAAVDARTRLQGERESNKVARWQNFIPSYPWIAPGRRAGGATQEKGGIKFCYVA